MSDDDARSGLYSSVMNPFGRLARRARSLIYRLILLNYGRAQRLYWELRAPDAHRLYGEDRPDAPTVLAILSRYKPRSVLDLGCGTGRFFSLYEELSVPHVLGVDISARALALARRAYPHVHTIRCRAEDLTTSHSFDLVVINRVLQHLPPENLAGVVATVCTVAKRLIFINEISDSDDRTLDHARYIFKHEYAPLFAQYGWNIVEVGVIPGTEQTYLLFEPRLVEEASSP